ncbi:hypothetical protein QJS10_CPB12g00773 [Acorus calamus]|uniref:Uncharacterized protein n=1 Tax=Acorus calamus TaxID=4465 RepID=A0AAV9DMS5_ACOCL|nr:hypothetical protein QJS10_CPB12g00773 [Acorus calamus]
MRRDVRDKEVGDAIFSLSTLETTIFIVDKGMHGPKTLRSTNSIAVKTSISKISQRHTFKFNHSISTRGYGRGSI